MKITKKEALKHKGSQLIAYTLLNHPHKTYEQIGKECGGFSKQYVQQVAVKYGMKRILTSVSIKITCEHCGKETPLVPKKQ